MRRRLEATRSLRSSFERVADVFLVDPGAVIGTPAGRDGRYHTEIVVDLGRGSSVHQVVAVEVGPPQRSPDTLRCSLSWNPVGRHAVLPSLDGELEVTRASGEMSSLVVGGSYRPPLSAVGAVGDSMVGRHVAHRSFDDFADALAARIDAAAEALCAGWHPAPYPDDLRPRAFDDRPA